MRTLIASGRIPPRSAPRSAALGTDSTLLPLRNGQEIIARIGDKLLIRGYCRVTKAEHHVTVNANGLQRWLVGNELIQLALPDLSPEDREFLITGTSPSGWDVLFGLDEIDPFDLTTEEGE